jgi:HTH-type transcriptional regulator/antitoxin MqsA
MSTPKACPICGEGLLTPHNEWVDVEYHGNRGRIASCYSVCDQCGSEQAGAAELRANKRAMIAFKKQVEGLLTGQQVREIRERLGLTQAEAAKAFGGGPVAFSKYEADDVMQSGAMDKLLRVAANVPEAYDFLAGHTGLAGVSFSGEWVSFGDSQASGVTTADSKKPMLRVVSNKILQEERKYG